MTVVTTDDAKAPRANRSWSAEYKLKVLAEIDTAKTSGDPGAVGEICRREGLYSSLVSEWRRQRERGALEALSDRPAGRKPKDRSESELVGLRARVTKLEAELATANELIEAQGKVSALWQERSRRSAEGSSPPS